MRRIFLHLGSSRVRLVLGLLLACLLLTQIVSSFDGKQVTAAPQPAVMFFDREGEINTELKRLAKTDHVKLLKLCLEHYQRSYRDYTCTLVKQERLKGQWGDPQTIDIRFKEGPFSVVMAWQVNAGRADKMLYVENAPDGNHVMYVHPTGLAGRLLKSVERSPEDPEVLQSSLRSIREFGFARGLQSLINVYEQARDRGHLIEASYLGIREVDGRPVLGLKRVLPEGHGYPSKVTIIEIDLEYLVPVHVKGTDWQNRDECDYEYRDIKLNQGLTDAEFTRQANGL